MNAMERLEELSEHLTMCGLRLVKRTKKYRVHQGWDDKHKIYLPLRGPVWVGPTLKEADTKYSTHTIKMYANAYARGPIRSGKRNMVTGKFAKPTVVDLVHPKPVVKRRRKKKKPMKTTNERFAQGVLEHAMKKAVRKPAVKPNPDIHKIASYPSSRDPKLIYDVTMHRTHGLTCNCPKHASGGRCSHIDIALRDAAIRMQHERTKANIPAW
jgi:hypothetical protein